jgi:uncharacterized protein (TIGR02001 family)
MTTLAAAVATALALPAQAELSANIGAVSNYVWRGATQTDDGPAIQGGIDYAHESGLFLGTWASNVEFGGDKYAEVDLYGGYGGSLGEDFSYKAGLYYYAYPKDDCPCDLLELGVSGTYKMFTAGVSYTLSGEADDEATFSEGDVYVYGTVAIPLPQDFSLGLTVGHYHFDDDADTSYTHGLIGISKAAGDFGTFGFNVSFAEDDANGDDDPRFYVSWVKSF